MSAHDDSLAAAVAAGALAAEERHRALLQSIVDVARAIFRARASSIFLHDETTDELVFEAVAGEGEETLIGQRFPSSTGIAGWVLVMRQPLVLDDVAADPRFARDVAQATGYVPKGLMAAPLLHEERALGVLSVLDRPAARRVQPRRARPAGPVRPPGRDRARPPRQRPPCRSHPGRPGRPPAGRGRPRPRRGRARRDAGGRRRSPARRPDRRVARALSRAPPGPSEPRPSDRTCAPARALASQRRWTRAAGAGVG